MPSCLCSYSGQILSVPVFKADCLWVSCCMVLGVDRETVGYWHGQAALPDGPCDLWAHPSHHLFGPFLSFTSVMKVSLEKSRLILTLLVSALLVKMAHWLWRLWRAFCIHSHLSNYSVLLPSSLFCMKSLATLGFGRKQATMSIKNANNSRFQEEFPWNSDEQLLLLVGFYY